MLLDKFNILWNVQSLNVIERTHTVLRLIWHSTKNFPAIIHKIVQSFWRFYRKPCITQIDPDHFLIVFRSQTKDCGCVCMIPFSNLLDLIGTEEPNNSYDSDSNK